MSEASIVESIRTLMQGKVRLPSIFIGLCLVPRQQYFLARSSTSTPAQQDA